MFLFVTIAATLLSSIVSLSVVVRPSLPLTLEHTHAHWQSHSIAHARCSSRRHKHLSTSPPPPDTCTSADRSCMPRHGWACRCGHRPCMQVFSIRRGLSLLCTFQLEDWRIVRRRGYKIVLSTADAADL